MLIKPWIGYLIALGFVLVFPNYYPTLRLFYFAPFIACSVYQTSFLGLLYRAFFAGLTLDLFSSSTVFGITGLNYGVVAAALFLLRRHFFEDKFSTLPIMTFLFSFISTLLYAFFCVSIGGRISLSWKWAYTDLLIMPLFDGLYALVCFVLPAFVYKKISRLKIYDYFRKSHR